MRGNYDDEGYLDDGDLPSLTPKGSNSIGSRSQDTTENEQNMTKLVSYNKGLKSKTDANGRQFWDQLDDESADESPNGTIATNNGNHVSNFGKASTGRTHYDDDGPDDEMAARRSIVVASANTENVPLKRSATDNSAPTDNESHLTDEEVEDEPYETSFCGQTLNAIEDMCGGGLNTTGNNSTERKSNNSMRRSSTTSPPMDRKRRSQNSPLSADNSRSPRRDYPPIGELQQENTAIEVEYMEPIKKTTSIGSDSGAPSETKRKMVRLNAIAKKAKEKFRNKKEKSSAQSIGSEPSSDQRGTFSQQEIGSAVVDETSVAASAAAENPAAANITQSLEGTEQGDTDYNSFNAAEKRKFIKLINSGEVATVAARQVLDERTKIAEQVPLTDETAVGEMYGMDDQDISTVVGEEADTLDMQPRPGVESIVDISASSAGTVPFKKSGSVYYDAVRRDGLDNDVSTDTQLNENFNNNGRPPSGFKGLEFGVAQRFFGGGKPKGFAALPDSPHQKSTSSNDETAAYAMDTVGSGAANNVRDTDKGKDVSSNTSFDSFVRNRAVADTGDLSIENYQMTPTREVAKLNSDQQQQETPESGVSTIVNSQSESALSHSILNNTANTLNDVDPGLSTSQLEADRDELHTEKVDPNFVPLPIIGLNEHEALQMGQQEQGDSSTSNEEVLGRSAGDDKSQEVSQIVSDEQFPGLQGDERSQGLSYISTSKIDGLSRMDISVDTNLNTTADVSHMNDAMSVYTTATSATMYTQSSRTRRPGVAKTKLAKQKELERTSANKAQGWHETILAAAESTKRKWDPAKGWVDYEEPEIVSTDVDKRKDKIRIDLNRSVVSHKEPDAADVSGSRKEPSVQVPFPQEWERERQAMILPKSTLNRKDENLPSLELQQNELIEQTLPSLDLQQNELIEQTLPSLDLQQNELIEQVKGSANGVQNAYKEAIIDEDEYGNVESVESDVYYDDIIVVGGDDEASRNVIEVVKQKVSEDDLELFPKSERIDEMEKMNFVPENRDTDAFMPPSNMDRVNTSLISLDASNMSSRRGAGPVDTDEVDETWDSDGEDRGDRDQSNNFVDLAEHHHIDGWKDSSKPSPRHDSTSQSTTAIDTNRSVGNVTNISGTSSSKKIPKLERSKRDTSPLSFRNPIEVAFPRSQESIQRHDNVEVEYEQPSAADNKSTSDKETTVSVPKASAASPATKIVASSRDETNIVQARLKEWESRIETSHSSDQGEPIEKNKNQGLLPVTAAGWRSFLGKKVQAEKTFAESQNSKTPQTEQLSEDFEPGPDLRNSKQHVRESTDEIFRFTDKGETSALNLSDLSPIQVRDDLSDYDMASSAAYGPTDEQRKSSSFLQRLTECTAPMMPTKTSTFCGHPEEVAEAENVADVSGTSSEKHRRSMSYGDEKPKSLSSLRGTSDAIRVSTSSVVSEDYGAKTAFLDSLAMKAAVSKPKRSSSSGRRYDQSANSSVVSGATDHSEKWKTFLERKKASDAAPNASRGSGADVSRAAEKYAAEKVEEIMSKMAARSKTTPRYRESRNEFTDVPAAALPNSTNIASSGGSISAAEDLAAARVEAMMAALANANVDEGEI